MTPEEKCFCKDGYVCIACQNQPHPSPSPEARVDWDKLDEQIDVAVDFWFEDCSCEQGQCCNSCNLKMELSKIFKSAAFEKGRESR